MKVKKLEIELLQYKTRQNRNRLDELLDDSFIEFAQDGKKYKKEEIIEILSKCLEEKIEIFDFFEKELGKEVVLVNYKINREIIKSGVKYSTLCSSLWQNKAGNWKMIFFQGTKSN